MEDKKHKEDHHHGHHEKDKKKKTMRTGRPDTAEPPMMYDFMPQPLENELFPEEWDALQELKKNAITQYFNDRFLAAFLLARKLDINRTLELLKSHMKWRKDHNMQTLPSFESLHKDLILSGFGLKIPGARDKNGCGLLFCKLGNMIPENFKDCDDEVVKWVIWNNTEGNLWEDMDFHRNGLTFVFDLADIGWKNVDLGLQRKINATLMDNFPMRVTKVLVVNAPSIFKSLLAAARLFVKKKVTDRIQLIEMEQIKDHVDEDVLPVIFGGSNPYKMQDFLKFVNRMKATCPIELPPKEFGSGDHADDKKLGSSSQAKTPNEKEKKKKKYDGDGVKKSKGEHRDHKEHKDHKEKETPHKKN